MKALVNVDYGWTLNVALRYARRQILMLTAIREKNVELEELVKLIYGSSTTYEAEKKMMERYGFEKVVAKEIMDLPLPRLGSLDSEKEMEYYTKVEKALKPLVMEFYDLQ